MKDVNIQVEIGVDIMKNGSVITMILIVLTIILSGCTQESKYEDALTLISENRLEEANELLNEVEIDYMDTNVLKTYIEANSEVNDIENDEVAGYSTVIQLLDNNIPNNYSGDLSKEINNMKDSIYNKQLEYEQQLLTEVSDLLTIDFEGFLLINEVEIKNATSILDNIYITDTTDIRKYVDSHFHKNQFIHGQDWNDLYTSYKLLTEIDSEYNGVLSEQIDKYILLQSGGLDKIKKEMKDIKGYIRFEANVPSPPRIGMNTEEVKESTWGEPQKTNKYTFENRIEEQWVYSNYRYIYLENGVVTAIKE